MYVIQTERLGLRNWTTEDIAPMTAINQDETVMEYFPRLNTPEETQDFVLRMQKQFADHRYCYFAVDRLDRGEFIGFIGLMDQNFESEITPCVDIGWRLTPTAWGQGFATEGARACLDYGLNDLQLSEVIAMAPSPNLKSQRVMIKLGMEKGGYFEHPMLTPAPHLNPCVWYFSKRKA